MNINIFKKLGGFTHPPLRSYFKVVMIAISLLVIGTQATLADDYDDYVETLRLANSGDIEAQFDMVLIYFDKNSKFHDEPMAMIWLEKAAIQNHTSAKALLGVFHIENNIDSKYVIDGINILQEKADEGETPAQVELGRAYVRGQHVTKNYHKAVYFFELAAKKGDAYAQSALGGMYYQGHGLRQDTSKALIWLTKSANQGDSYSQHSIGLIYLDKTTSPYSKSVAKEWFGKACDGGNQSGCDFYKLLN